MLRLTIQLIFYIRYRIKAIILLKKENQDKQSSKKEFKIIRPPQFEFDNLPDTERLSYEMLDEHNYLEVYQMFKEDDNPFVIEEYKQLEKLDRYVDALLNYAKTSAKRGGCDWLVKLRETGAYISLINIYDLNRETFNDNHKKCMIGFTTAKNYRQQYYTFESVKHLIHYAVNHFGMELIIADTDKQNEVSKKFLRKLGFVEATNKYYYADKYDFFEYTVK